MSKELKALERLKTAPSFMGGTAEYQFCTKSETLLMQDYETVKQALKRLESIDNATLSEALYELKRIDYNITYLLSDCDINEEVSVNFNSIRDNKSCEVIKSALLKAQEQEKENELLKEIIKSLFDRGCPLHQYIDKEGVLTIEVDNECSIMRLGEYKGVDLDAKLKEVLE